MRGSWPGRWRQTHALHLFRGPPSAVRRTQGQRHQRRPRAGRPPRHVQRAVPQGQILWRDRTDRPGQPREPASGHRGVAGSGWSLTGAAVFYWRQSLDDGVYGNPGNLIRPSAGSRARYVGTQGEVVLGWEATTNVTLETSYALFEPGPS
ncbi:alginate export family protein [Chenggangzhangella methanolivorans]|uniref:Alginate export family protein n=1 Tax=Chenggangzhangella methanolivorans TaxID=1437009 RepID=A0A9E6UNP3_9HYPH|nr:alginate export family protein [Chenggangzhangella methanolivorans]